MTGLATFGATNSAQANEVPVVQTLGESSAYNLTKLDVAPESITSNVITNYVYDEVSGSLTKEYYKYDLAKTEYGSGANTRYYKWVDGVMTRIETDASGNPLETPELVVKNPNSGACMWRPNNQTVNGHWYVDQNGSTLDGWGSTSSPFKSTVINSYFIESSATGTNGQTNHGGAIRGFSMSEYTGISGTFIGNHATASGGAIYNYVQYTYNPDDAYAKIGDINADFIGNYVNNTVGDFMEHGGGGAIFNSGIDGAGYNVEIGDITGNFIGNYVTTERLNVYGGAIQNQTAKIGDIKGDFVNNHITGTASDKGGYGGAIYNGNSHAGKGAIIDSLTGDFVGNYVKAGSEAHGGAIYNGYDPIYLSNDRSSTITSIIGNFYNNYVYSNYSEGGAIYNTGTINSIDSDFIGNYVEATSSTANGGAIYNTGTISSITGDFSGNYATQTTSGYGSSVKGGAIYNSGEIGDIYGDFINNYITNDYEGSRPYGEGGAIYNAGTINNIYGDFINNGIYLNGERSGFDASGGAIYNTGKIGNIIGDFIGNGGTTIENRGSKIDNISGNFIGNDNNVIYNFSKIGLIEGLFTENQGNVIYNNDGVIDKIDADFINNKGLTIYNCGNGEITEITGDFIGNKKAIENFSDHIGSISGNFIDNGINGAIENWADGRIDSISGLFINNKNYEMYDSYGGGAISNNYNKRVSIGNINADFIRNSSDKRGGAVSNMGLLDSISGDFYNNYVITGSSGGAIYNSVDFYFKSDLETIDITIDVNSYFEGNYVNGETNASGGAIYNGLGKIILHDSDFKNNYVLSPNLSYGGAIYAGNLYESLLSEEEMSSEWIAQYMEAHILNEDGSIYKSIYIVTEPNGSALNEDQIKVLVENGTITGFKSSGNSEQVLKTEFEHMLEQNGMSEEQFFEMYEQYGAIYTDPNTFLSLDHEQVPVKLVALSVSDVRSNEASITLKNSSFVGNYAESTVEWAKGGAIYGDGSTIKFEANNGKTTLISGNYTKNGAEIDDNAIYMNGGELIFDVINASTIQFDDNIDGFGYNTYIIGDDSSKFILNNKIKNSITHLIDTNLYLTQDSNLDGNDLGLHSGVLHLINNQVGLSALKSLTVTGDTNVLVDVDLANKTMDRFTASEYGSHSGNLNVVGMNLLSDAVDPTTEILFAENGLKDNVTYGGADLPNKDYQTTLYTPIYKYNVSYDNRDDAGYFVFSRPSSGGAGSSSSDAFNPAVLGSSTSATVGATATMNQAFNYSFQHSADFMNIPYLERVSMRDRNKYALSVTGDATDMGRFSPLYQPSDEEASVWVKPYATFETVGLKNGPKVHNNTYGTLIGFDTEMKSLKRGWDRVFTGYIGYNGASQRYSGIDSTQNGGLIGGTVTMYKGNFFNATTVSVGANVAQNQTMYGSEDFAMLLSGIGNKTGYNFEFKEGKLILQPSMLMSYTFVNTFDYTNAAGVRIDNKPLHALQLAPGVKVIGNLKNGWQPYASVQMVWNLMGESDATANGVKLPEMSIKPYVQYGVGLQKRIKDHFTAYGQAMIQNGGRNGVSLTAGFRWALGHDNCKYKVDKSVKSAKGHYEEQSDVVIPSNNETAQNDSGKCHRGQVPRSQEIAKQVRNDKGRKILKQLSPEQKTALGGGKYYNTSRTAKTGSLRQY